LATNLDPADTEPNYDAYVKDLGTGDVTVISASDPSLPGRDDRSFAGSLSANGLLATFSTQANNVDVRDPDHQSDVWVRDLTTGALTLVSASAAGVKGNDDSATDRGGSISADDSRVAFSSESDEPGPG
jgi:hypothetical protein